MTGRALFAVDHLAACDELRVVRVGFRRLIGRVAQERPRHEQQRYGADQQDAEVAGQGVADGSVRVGSSSAA